MRIVSLTTTQRDLLRQLLAADGPLSAAALGEELHLSPRQVHYGLREVRHWLNRRNLTLQHLPGVGIQLRGEPAEKRALLEELSGQTLLQLVLSAEQRQQLLALRMLSINGPVVLGRLQEDLLVSRATVLKDFELVEAWLGRFALGIARRQHRGCWVAGAESARRQALAALLWGDGPWGRSVLQVHLGPSISFALADDAELLPIVAEAARLVDALDLDGAQALITAAEHDLGCQYTDEAFTWLAVAVGIQLFRIAMGAYVDFSDEQLRWARAQVAWPVALRLLEQLLPARTAAVATAEAAALTALLCAAPRDGAWGGADNDTRRDDALVEKLLQQIAVHYRLPALLRDEQLRDGLEAHTLPSSVRVRFAFWWPAPPSEPLDERVAQERVVATELAETITAATGATLPPDAREELALLIRAAFVRARPERTRRVLVVCPSGMATTQLLVARLRASMPRLGAFEVLPLRSLTPERIADADLIIATVPLTLADDAAVPIIQVHPSLRPEDVAVLTDWMARAGK